MNAEGKQVIFLLEKEHDIVDSRDSGVPVCCHALY